MGKQNAQQNVQGHSTALHPGFLGTGAQRNFQEEGHAQHAGFLGTSEQSAPKDKELQGLATHRKMLLGQGWLI